MDLTSMLSDRPGTRGRKLQIPRATILTITPAWEALYRASIISESTSELTFIQMPAGRPATACAISSSIRAIRKARRFSGEITTFFRLGGLA